MKDWFKLFGALLELFLYFYNAPKIERKKRLNNVQNFGKAVFTGDTESLNLLVSEQAKEHLLKKQR